MKTLFRLAVVVVVLLAGVALALRDSPYWTPLEIQRGLQDRDVARVERAVALERFSRSSTEVLGSLLAADVGIGGDDIGSKALSALVGAVAERIGGAMSRESAQEMRRAIREGRLERRIGPFEINDGFDAIGRVSTTIDGGTLEIRGHCDDVDASLVLLLERYDDGIFGGRPRRYVVVGIDADSGRTLAKQCRASTSPPRRPAEPKWHP